MPPPEIQREMVREVCGGGGGAPCKQEHAVAGPEEDVGRNYDLGLIHRCPKARILLLLSFLELHVVRRGADVE